MKFKLLFYIVLLFPHFLLAQNMTDLKALRVGDSISHLVFRNLENSDREILSAKELKGKAIIIDFWTNGCVSCFEAMPKLENLKNKYSDQLQIILINPWEPKDKIFTRLKQMQKQRPDLKLPALPNIYGDTSWRYIFPHRTVPHHIWIDKKGKIVSIINGYDATEENIIKLINGDPLNITQKDDFILQGKDVRKDFLLDPFIPSLKREYYSAIFTSNLTIGSRQLLNIDSVARIFRKTILNRSVLELYMIACKLLPFEKKRILLEVSDPYNLQYPNDPGLISTWAPNNCFSYELVAPLEFQNEIHEFMLTDLNRYFGIKKGIVGNLEKRFYPAYIFSISSDYKGKEMPKSQIVDNGKSYSYISQPASHVFSYLKEQLEDFTKPIAFVPDPNIKPDTQITIELPKSFDNMQKVTALFKRQGFTLALENKEIEMLVIKKKR